MFDPNEWNREVRGGMITTAILGIAAICGAALIVGAVLYWWITTRN